MLSKLFTLFAMAFLLTIVNILPVQAQENVLPNDLNDVEEVIYEWYQGEAPQRMIPVDDGLCVLQGVSGNFRGEGEAVTIYSQDGYWYLWGESHQEGVWGKAGCMQFYQLSGARAFRYSVRPAWASVRRGSCPFLTACAPGGQNQIDLDPLNSFCYLTGMSGRFDGGGEFIDIYRNAVLNQQSLRIETAVDEGFIKGEAGCFMLMQQDVKLIGPFNWSQGEPAVALPTQDAAFCAIMRVSGGFQGAGEMVTISSQTDGTQSLSGSSLQEGVAAQAICLAYDQRDVEDTSQSLVTGYGINLPFPASGWYTEPLSIALTPTGGAEGAIESYYQLNNGAVTLATGPINIVEDGTHTFSYYSIDSVGEREPTQILTINLDRTPPITTLVPSSTQVGSDNWYGQDVTLAFNGVDGASGVKSIFYSLNGEPEQEALSPLNVTEEGWHTITYYAVDNAGHRELAQTYSFGIDRTAPTAGFEVSGGLTATWSLIINDDSSGIVPESTQISFDGVNFQPYTMPVTLALHPQVWATTVDKAGNVGVSMPQMWFDTTTDRWDIREVVERGPKATTITRLTQSMVRVFAHKGKVPVQADASYQLQVWARGTEVLGTVEARIIFRDGNGKYLDKAALPLPTGDFDWTLFEMTVVAPNKAATAQIELHQKGWGRVWFDDLSFVDSVNPTVNLAPDPGFEMSTESPWQMQRQRGRGAMLLRVTDVFHTGAQSLLLTANEARSDGTSLRFSGGSTIGETHTHLHWRERALAKPGQQYQAIVWVRVNKSKAHIAMVFRDANDKRLVRFEGSEVSGQSDWIPLMVDAVAPPDAAQLNIIVQISGSGTVWLDDVLLSES